METVYHAAFRFDLGAVEWVGGTRPPHPLLFCRLLWGFLIEKRGPKRVENLWIMLESCLMVMARGSSADCSFFYSNGSNGVPLVLYSYNT
jgi:hypothetical protein